MLYGSWKPGGEPYRVYHSFDDGADKYVDPFEPLRNYMVLTWGKNGRIEKVKDPEYQLPLILSTRTPKEHNDYYLQEAKPIERPPSLSRVEIDDESDSNPLETVFQPASEDFVEKLVELIDPTRFDGHNERFNICCAIKSTGADFSVFDNKFSESSDYESSKSQRMWDSIQDPRSTIGTLM